MVVFNSLYICFISGLVYLKNLLLQISFFSSFFDIATHNIGLGYYIIEWYAGPRQVLEPKAPPTRNGPNTGSLAPGERRSVNEKGIEQLSNLLKSTKKINTTKQRAIRGKWQGCFFKKLISKEKHFQRKLFINHNG